MSTHHFRSTARNLYLGMLGWLITIAFVFGGLMLLYRLRFGLNLDYDSWTALQWNYFPVFIVFILVLTGVLLFARFKSYWPSQWNTELTIRLDERTIERRCGGKTEILSFDRIQRVIYQGVAPIFTTAYLYWADIGARRIALIAFRKESESNEFYNFLEREAKIRVEQEASAP
jgi:hypothetical protein